MDITTIRIVLDDNKADKHAGEGIAGTSSNSIIRKWVNVNPDQLDDAIKYLQLYTSAKNDETESSSVTDLIVDKSTLDGVWRGGMVTQRRDDAGKYTIFQELHEGFISTLDGTYIFQASSSDAVPDIAGLKFYDSGIDLNGADILYSEDRVYAKWTHPTEGEVITLIGDVGEDSLVDYFKWTDQDYPDEITANGSGWSNQVLPFHSFTAGSPSYGAIGPIAEVTNTFLGVWQSLTPGGVSYAESLDYLPPKTWWDTDLTLEYAVPEAGYIGQGAYSGTVTLGAISEAFIDLTGFYIQNAEYFHSNHDQPVLRLRNVAYSAVNEICQDLNVDAYGDIYCYNGKLDGPWSRIKVRNEIEEDGSYSIFLFLTDTANTTQYVRFKVGPNTWRGLYHKWDADSTTVEELEQTIQFSDIGEIVESGGKTLQEAVDGRTAEWTRINRDEADRLFDLLVSITWEAEYGIDTSGTPAGTYNETRWTEIFINYKTLPADVDLAPTYDTVHGQWRIDRQLSGKSGNGEPNLNPDGTYSYSIVSVKTEAVDTDWHISGIGHKTVRQQKAARTFQQIRRRIGGDLEFEKDSEGNLTGIEWNGEWTDETYPTSTPDNWASYGYERRYGAWKTHWVKGFMMGPGSLRSGALRLAPGVGSTQYEETTCRGPHNATDVYQIGDVVWGGDSATAWAIGGGGVGGYDSGDVVTYDGKLYVCILENVLNDDSGYEPDTENGATYWTANAFKILTSAPLWVYGGGDYGEGAVVQAGSKVYRCISGNTNNDATAPGSPLNNTTGTSGATFWSEGAQDAAALIWVGYDEDLVSSRIAISGVGDFPFEEPDYKIPILQELNEELSWDNDWEWESAEAYDLGHVVVWLESYPAPGAYVADSATAAGESPFTHSGKWTLDNTATPTGWVALYSDRHGDWQARWTKGFAIGSGSVKSNPVGATICRGVYDGGASYQIGEVASFIASAGTPDFRVVSGATLWVYSGGDYSVGAVVQSGSKVYTCISGNINNDASAPGTAVGARYWSEGAIGSAVTWVAFDKDYVVSKVAGLGVGLPPFETFEMVGVLGSDGGYALGSSARVSFYVSPLENPRFGEITEAMMQQEEQLIQKSFFAVDPNWLPEANRRLPDWTDEASLITDVTAILEAVDLITIPVNSDGSNFEVNYTIDDLSGGNFVIILNIIITSEMEPDTVALQTIVNQSLNGGYSGKNAIVFTDLTGLAEAPWTGNYLDAG